MPERPTPTGTYRLQLAAAFGFADARALVPYLARLGVSHLYLSPILQAAPGSRHGYDVVDHARVSADLGGEEGLLRLAGEAHAHGLGLLVDIVPNHMALAAPLHLNRPLWEVLRRGAAAATAHWFDVDWDHVDGRFPLPLLGEPADVAIEAESLVLDPAGGPDGEPVLRYHEHVFPVADGTGTGTVSEMLARQHYLLASWRDKDDVLAYRRFFDVDGLVAIRVENDEVWDATHALLLDLHRRGVVDGFRIDHPDGLADPHGYLDRLAERTGGAWVVVEKILAPDESLPDGWAAAGSTGYDALRVVQQALLPPTGSTLEQVWADTGAPPDLAVVEQRAKHEAVTGLLQPEVRRLTRVAVRAAADVGEEADPVRFAAALAELLVGMDVYRAYVRPDEPVGKESAARLGAAAERAELARPDLTAELWLLRRLLLDSTTASLAGRDLVVRFQQTCGPVLAKGVEDTTYYRWHELVALAEVGGDPAGLEQPSVAALHDWARRQQARHPAGLTALSTHDTKRSEDVRARLLAAAGDPPAWRAAWGPVRDAADRIGIDRPTAYLVFQTVVGAWPIDLPRLEEYLVKAAREAKRRTTWTDPDQAYERRVVEVAAAVLDDPGMYEAVTGLVDACAAGYRATVLAAKLLQLMVPGVPDCYQGCEIVNLSLVDPDNRRPVDHAQIASRLDRLDAGGPPADLSDEKLLVTSRALRLRRDRPDLFGAASSHEPLTDTGPHLVGFHRGRPGTQGAVTLATRWPARLAAVGGWGPHRVSLPPGTWTDVLTGRTTTGGPQPVAELLTDLPVALLATDLETLRSPGPP